MIRFGNREIKFGLLLAPLAGISDSSFRRICKSYGAELTFSEMVSAEGICRMSERSLRYLRFNNEERPIGIQIFGSNPESMKEAAVTVERDCQPDLIDINAGCPVRKVTRTGSGAALLKDLSLLGEIVRNVVSCVHIPISSKIRLGWNKSNYVEVVKLLQDCGVAFITVHARRAIDDFSKKADWSVFEKIKSNVSIPVVANGDISDVESASFLLNEIGVDGIMIGREAVVRPWIFNKIKDYLKHGKKKRESAFDKRLKLLLRQINMMKEHVGNEKAAKKIKKQIGYCIKGFPGAKQVRNKILAENKLENMVSLIRELL
jgi:tRNA-dihydrouridine synthase B